MLFLFADNFDERVLIALAVKLKIKDLFPGSKIHTAICDRYDHLAAHDGPLEMRVCVILKTVMMILAVGLFRSQFFEPYLIIVVQALSLIHI